MESRTEPRLLAPTRCAGCVLATLATGSELFEEATDERSLLRVISQLRGAPPSHMMQASPAQVAKEPPHDSPARGQEKGQADTELGRRLRQLRQLRRSQQELLDEGGASKDAGSREGEGAGFSAFLELLCEMLRVDPATRITPAEALAHRFFQWRTQRQIIEMI